jgi:hypothetical protein
VELEHGITLLTSPTRLIGFSAWQLADALKAIW